MDFERIVIIGASGFMGSHLVDALKEEYKLVGLARRSRSQAGIEAHPNLSWFQVDICDRLLFESTMNRIKDEGEIDVVVQLAAYFDFTGDEHPDYHEVNVKGMRNVLEACKKINPGHFIFVSSLAVSDFPEKGCALDENSPSDGRHIYSRTKAIGEKMLEEYKIFFTSSIIRLAAVFSDWCKYPPLYGFLQTWLGDFWNSRILAGKGKSAIPYLHIRDAVSFLVRHIKRRSLLKPSEVVICSPDYCVSHYELFSAATRSYHGSPLKPVKVPAFLCRTGLVLRRLFGKLCGNLPMERPWMCEYIDKIMTVDPGMSWRKLGWRPRERLGVLRRLPILIENYKLNPVEWQFRNQQYINKLKVGVNLKLRNMLIGSEPEIISRSLRRMDEQGKTDLIHYSNMPRDEVEWVVKLILHELISSVAHIDRSIFIEYCRNAARRRYEKGFYVGEISRALEIFGAVCVEVLVDSKECADIEENVRGIISTTIQLGIDQVLDVYEELGPVRVTDEV